jgi:Domain of unknown function (DUF4304)
MNRQSMNAALRDRFVPLLRERGFKGSLPHFRRIDEDRIDLLTLQFDKYGGGFVIEISRCPLDGVTTAWGKNIPAARVTAHDLHHDERHRLGSPAPGQDGRWFRYDKRKSAKTVADDAASMLPEADAWWTSAKRRATRHRRS